MKYIFVLLSLFTELAWADPSLKRVEEIKQMVEQIDPETMFQSVTFMNALPLETPAASRHAGNQQYVIGINHKYFDALAPAAQKLVMFHELGHILLGHTELSEEDFDAYEVELEADYFAAYMFRRFEITNSDILKFIQEISNQQTVPSGALRAKIFSSIVTAGE